MSLAEPSPTPRLHTVDRLIEAGVVAVVRVQEASKLLPVVEAVVAGGVTAIEITMTVPDAIDQITALVGSMGDQILLGVGSVLDEATARKALEAGARYLVSPVFKPELIDVAHLYNAPALPGCFTPTEVYRAHEAGADIIKIFPADVVGMPFFKAILAPMPNLKLMPTGGVTLANAGDWLRAGACAVGVGSALLDRVAIVEGRYDELTRNARRLRERIDAARTHSL